MKHHRIRLMDKIVEESDFTYLQLMEFPTSMLEDMADYVPDNDDFPHPD